MSWRAVTAVASLLVLSSTAAGQSRPAALTFDVICRGAWGARKPTKPYVKHTIKRLTVHHSGAALRDNRSAPGRVRSAQRYHQSRGWPDIAYHYLIDRAGNIYEGRPVRARGDTGTRYDTTGHFLVCVVGDYDRQEVAPAQVTALANLLAHGAKRFKVGLETVRGHRQLAKTKCPGKHLQALIDNGTLRKRARQVSVEMRLVCGDKGRDRIRAIRKR